jgi:hypothetical protein
MPPREPKVKGVAFRSVLAALAELRGQAVVESVLASMPAADAEMLRYRIVQTGWYPISLYRAMWSAISSETQGGHDLARAVGAAAIRRDLTGVYRLAFKLLSPETVYSLSSKLFGNYYDTGKLTTRQMGRGHARAVYEGCDGFDRTMWEELAGSAVELLRLAGGKNPRVSIVRGGQEGQSSCEMQVTWE